MNDYIKRTLIITQKMIKDTFLNPLFHILSAAGFITLYIVISGFIGIIKSDGLNPENNPLYEILFKLLTGMFGESFPEKLFSEGPFVLALYVSFFPVLIFLAVDSLFTLGYEKMTGALELVIYGPVGADSYILGSLLKNLFYALIQLTAIIILSVLSAIITNMALGLSFFATAAMLFFFSLSVFSLEILCASFVSYGFASLILFTGVTVFFLILRIETIASIQGYIAHIGTILSDIVQFISPFAYLSNGLSAIDFGNLLFWFLNMFFLLLLSLVFTGAGYFISRKKGVTI